MKQETIILPENNELKGKQKFVESTLQRLEKGLQDLKRGRVYKLNPKTGKKKKTEHQKHLERVLEDVKKGKLVRTFE